MKKLLGFVILILSFVNNSYALNEFTISCEGVVNIKNVLSSGSYSEQKNFYEDYRISTTDDNKRVLGIEIISSSHRYFRTGFYMQGESKYGKFTISSDKTTFILEEDDNTEVNSSNKKSTTSNIRTRLSITNSSTIGSFVHTIELSNSIGTAYHDYIAECSGTRELYAALKQQYPDNPSQENPESNNIDKNEIVVASSGSGFFVSPDGDIITNHHVIDQCESVKVNFKGSSKETKTLATDKVNDIAIIKVDINPDKYYSVSKDDVSLLEEVVVAGYPLGKKVSSAIKTHKGVVTSLAGAGDNFSNFQTDAAINAGNSGGPILNQKGNVVGIAVATWVQEGVQSIHFGIKSSTLRAFASSNSLEFDEPNKKDLSNKELGQIITSATVYLECHMTIAKIKEIIDQENNQKAFFSKFK